MRVKLCALDKAPGPGKGAAVRSEDGRTRVMVVRDGVVQAVPVEVGLGSETVVEVLAGLALTGQGTPTHLVGACMAVVGLGNSAADIATELSYRSCADQVFLVVRSSAWVLPKWIGGTPITRLPEPTRSLHWLPWQVSSLLARLLMAHRGPPAGTWTVTPELIVTLSALVGTALCHAPHTGVVLSGHGVVLYETGERLDLLPGQAFHINSTPHDSWVEGDQPYVSLHLLSPAPA